jgi:hypothetical protein
VPRGCLSRSMSPYRAESRGCPQARDVGNSVSDRVGAGATGVVPFSDASELARSNQGRDRPRRSSDLHRPHLSTEGLQTPWVPVE